MMTEGTEVVSEVLTEVWGMFMDDGLLWRSAFDTKKRALEASDSTPLKVSRKRASATRKRKEGYFKIIRKAWG